MSKDDGEPRRKRGRPANDPSIVPDIDYINALFEQSGTLQRDLAARLGMSEQVFTKLKTGKRPATLTDAIGMSEFFGVSLDTLIPRLGFKTTPRGVPIVGKVTSESRVSPVAGIHKGKKVAVDKAPLNAVAYIYEPDDTVFIVDKGAPNGPALQPGAISRWCVVEASNYDLPLLGKLARGPSRDKVSLHTYYGDKTLVLDNVHSAAVVTSILSP